MRHRVVVDFQEPVLEIAVSGDPAAVAAFVDAIQRRSPQHPAVSPVGCGWAELTRQEAAVAKLVCAALTNQQIANRLGISSHTVNFHLRQIFRKLGLTSRVELASRPPR